MLDALFNNKEISPRATSKTYWCDKFVEKSISVSGVSGWLKQDNNFI